MAYKHFGIMLDVSRNAVMKVSEVKKLIDYLVKMGYNTLELYAEDTYKLKEDPAFGYLRGGYSGAEIKEIDAYAKSKGVELIPCVQTLAHFTNLVKLPPYRDIIDCQDILLIDEEKTYDLIEKIFANAAENFTSRLINIGMDEAHMVGLGKYLDKHGYTNRFELLTRHLARVANIAKKYGFIPHMWSDMFFRLGNDGEYYVKGYRIPEEVASQIPENVELAYWDYYNIDVQMYDEMFATHLATGRNTWFAGGAWSWNGFAPYNNYTLKTMKPAMESVRKNGIEHVLITMWGDNGAECSVFSLLPSLYAVRQYAEGNFDEEKIAKDFEELFGLSYADFFLLDTPNHSKYTKEQNANECVSKVFLFCDPFMGVFDNNAAREVIDYEKIADDLLTAEKKAGEFGYIFHCLGLLCKTLAVKMTLGVETRKAYRAGDKKGLRALIKRYKETEKRLAAFYETFKTLWFTENKAFGWEVQDARLGGLARRLESCRTRLQAYVDGKVDAIEELEEDILDLYPYIQANSYQFLTSVSVL